MCENHSTVMVDRLYQSNNAAIAVKLLAQASAHRSYI